MGKYKIMMTVIKEINNKEIWENFLLNCSEKTFLQSWNWGEFNKLMGNKIWRLGIYETENLIAVALITKISARRGIFLSCPHGPVIKDEYLKNFNKKSIILEVFLSKIKEIAKEEKAVFLRLSPIWERTEDNLNIFKKNGFRDAPIHLHPDLTWELDIQSSAEDLLMQMRKTHRYLIRKAQKDEDIKIELSQNINDIRLFDEIYKETFKRHHFIPYSLDYLENEFKVFQPDNQIVIFLGKYQNKVIASGIIVYWQEFVFYHHGATSLKHSKIPITYLMQMEIIKEGKRRGCKKYNFWGIAPEDIPNHPWAGFTLFKKGFGGYKKEYVKTQDYPLSLKYWPVFVFENLRRVKRRL